MTQQFSKLNKIGNSFKQKRGDNKANFIIGKLGKNETSSDSDDDDYENSIFQPNVSMETGSLQYDSSSGGCQQIEQAVEATEDSALDVPKDVFLPSVGIVMGNKNDNKSLEATLEQKENRLRRTDSAQVDEIQLSSIMDNVSITSSVSPTPEIQINNEHLDANKKQPPKTLNLEKKFSHSYGDVNDKNDGRETMAGEAKFERSSSDYEVALNITQSQSESALRKLNNVASPVASSTKDMVLSPFSKLAKGVQNLSANLDPRKLGGQVRQITEKDIEEHRKFQEKWQNSKTRLIAL